MRLQTEAVEILLGPKTLTYSPQVFSAGSKVQISGPSGCGKSSYFRYLLDLLPREFLSVPPPLGREAFAWVPQDFRLGQGVCRELMKELIGFLEPSNKKENQSLFSKVQATLQGWSWPKDLWDQNFTQISGGEKQRLALALATNLSRPWILIDEGLSGIEPNLLSSILKDLEASPLGPPDHQPSDSPLPQ
jgi:ABC-type Mn2+/Zn2+ transport system ATPase subunit